MSIFEHQRWEIWNQVQHPYKHSIDEITGYTNGALPGVSTFTSAMDWILAVLYPIPKAAVATPAALPAVGNTVGDYRVVTNDGDGKSAGYRWEQREGDAVAKWYKIYDMDFGAGSVLQQAMDNAQELFVQKFGNDDLDSTGAAVAGTYAGQVIYGGKTASKNLTLRANAGDGVGANTGYVQVDDRFRTLINGTQALPAIANLNFDTTGIFWQAGPIFSISVGGNSIFDVSTGGTTFRGSSFTMSSTQAGAALQFNVANGSNTASSQSVVESTIAGTSATGNAIFRSTVTGSSGRQWAWGGDQANSGRFSIAQNSNVGSNDFLTISTAGLVTLGVSGATSQHTAYGKWYVETSSAELRLTSTGANTSATVTVMTATGVTTGDPYIVFLNADSSSPWSVGRDTSATNAFKISASGSLGTNDYLSITTGGLVTIGTGTSTQHALNTLLATNGAQTATLLNLPAAATAGNPAVWIPISINGTTTYIPGWH